MLDIFKKKSTHIVVYRDESGKVLFTKEGTVNDILPYLANVGDEVSGAGNIYNGEYIFVLNQVVHVGRRITPIQTKTIITVKEMA